MNQKSLLWIVAVVVALVAGWQFASAQVEKGKAQKWEYKVLVGEGEAKPAAELLQDVEKLGEDGWELVAVEPASGFAVGNRPSRNLRIFHFKRPK